MIRADTWPSNEYLGKRIDVFDKVSDLAQVHEIVLDDCELITAEGSSAITRSHGCRS